MVKRVSPASLVIVIILGALTTCSLFLNPVTGQKDQGANGTEEPEDHTAAAPNMTPEEELFAGFTYVTIETTEPDAHIYYTVDGTTPTEQSRRYTEPFLLLDDTTVSARCFREGYEPSSVVQRSFIAAISPAALGEVRVGVRPNKAVYVPGEPVAVDIAIEGATDDRPLYPFLLLIDPEGNPIEYGGDAPGDTLSPLVGTPVTGAGVLTLSESWIMEEAALRGVYRLLGFVSDSADGSTPLAIGESSFACLDPGTMLINTDHTVTAGTATLPIEVYYGAEPTAADIAVMLIVSITHPDQTVFTLTGPTGGSGMASGAGPYRWTEQGLFVGTLILPQIDRLRYDVPIADLDPGTYSISAMMMNFNNFSVTDQQDITVQGPVSNPGTLTVAVPQDLNVDETRRYGLRVVELETLRLAYAREFDQVQQVSVDLEPGVYVVLLTLQRENGFPPLMAETVEMNGTAQSVAFSFVRPQAVSWEEDSSDSVVTAEDERKARLLARTTPFDPWDTVSLVRDPHDADFFRGSTASVIEETELNQGGTVKETGYGLLSCYRELTMKWRRVGLPEPAPSHFRNFTQGRYMLKTQWVQKPSGPDWENDPVEIAATIVNRETCEELVSVTTSGLPYAEAFGDLYLRLRKQESYGTIENRLRTELNLDATTFYDYQTLPRYHPISPESLAQGSSVTFPDQQSYTPGVDFPLTITIREYNNVPIAGFDFHLEISVGASVADLVHGDQIGDALSVSSDTDGIVSFSVRTEQAMEPQTIRVRAFRGKNNGCTGLLYEQYIAILPDPRVLTWSPTDASTEVPLDSTIRLAFSDPMDRSSTEEAFTIQPSTNGTYQWSDDNTVLTFSPTEELDHSTRYTCSVGTGATTTSDAPGRDGATPLGTTESISFETRVFPVVESVSPANNAVGVPTDSTIGLTFSIPMDRDSVQQNVTIIPAVTGSYIWHSDTFCTLSTTSGLDPETTYTVTVPISVQSTTGRRLFSEHSFQFKTKQYGTDTWQVLLGGTHTDAIAGITGAGDGSFLFAGGSESPEVPGDSSDDRWGDAYAGRVSSAGTLDWHFRYGGSSTDSFADVRVVDGSYLYAGVVRSDVDGLTRIIGSTTSPDESDYLACGVSPSGQIEWARTYGDVFTDVGRGILPAAGDTAVIYGNSELVSYDTGTPQQGLKHSLLLVGLNDIGTELWRQSIDIGSDMLPEAGAPTSDGGYVFGVHTSNPNYINIPNWNAGHSELIIKTDSTGTPQWYAPYGRLGLLDDIRGIAETSDGDYVVFGHSWKGMDTAPDYQDAYLARFSSAGELLWDKVFAGDKRDRAADVIALDDGSIILLACTESTDIPDRQAHGAWDIWLVKLDQAGEIVWQRSYGGTSEDYANDFELLPDGGFIIGGHSSSDDIPGTNHHPYTGSDPTPVSDRDGYLIRVDANGEF